MIKKTKFFLLWTLVLSCVALTVDGVAAAAPHRVRLDNGTTVDAWAPATAEGGWLTFVMSDGTRAVVQTDPGARIDAPAGGQWDDAVMLLASGGAVQLRGDVRVNGGSLIFKRKDGLALTLPASLVARATAVFQPLPVRTNQRRTVRRAEPTGTVVAITNEDLPEVDDPSPEVGAEPAGPEAEVAGDGESRSEDEEAEVTAEPAGADDEDWWRSEMSRLNLKLETAQKKIYVAFTEKKALEEEIASAGGLESNDQKKRLDTLDRHLKKAERERAKVRAERNRLQQDAKEKEVPEEWLRGS